MSLDAEGRVICHDGPIKPEGTERGGRFMIDRKKKWFDYVDGSTPEINRAAIYELDGDILQVCSNSRDKDARPDKIEVGPDFVLEKWKRVKPMEKK